MPLFGIRRTPTARLTPELDDRDLGRVRKQVEAPAISGMSEIQIDQVERLLKDTGADWDRRAHRIGVLAESAADSNLARSWLLRRPRHADALVLHARVDLVRARRANGTVDAQAVADRCYRAAELWPEDPTPWVVLLGLLRVQRSRPHEVFAVWDEITSRDPWNRDAHLEMLGYLGPEEGGSRSQTLDFVDATVSGMPAQAPTAGLALTAEVSRYRRTVVAGGVDALLADRLWGHAHPAAMLDRALADWTVPGFLAHAAALADLNLLAYALVEAKRPRDAGQVFALLGGTVTAWPWGLDGQPVERFSYWRSRSQG
ncbi:hypothetical protein ACIGXM_19950 [Kitasatospora sp. NPDC052896]|uniref:hypothetical protein n=1 Tax=Kitasatospora sp. NPDC052896 TaxID=3364061 RepID=UPI0037C75813